MWIDTSSNFGTTAVAGRLVSAEITIPGEVTPKFRPTGAGGNITYSAYGVGPRSATVNITTELLDTTEYDRFGDDELVKIRLRANGPLISSTYYNYFQFDIYGRMQLTDFGDLEGVNRTVQFEVQSQYESGELSAGWVAYVQNENGAL